MKVLIVGGGGREHAIASKIIRNPKVKTLYALSGNSTMEKIATCVAISPTNLAEIVAFAVEKKVDFAIVSPDNPLCMGLVDLLTAKGVKTFGPNKAAARIEGSKVFSKNLMEKYGIPTAAYQVFSKAEEAKNYLLKKQITFPVVVKADGLAYGKGVVICQNQQEAQLAIKEMMENKVFGDSGNEIVIEEFLQGPEVSVLCFTDGKTIKPMVSSMDYKKAYDGDKGPNTGGMGAIAPNPYYTEAIADFSMEKIFIPTINALKQEGSVFKGCLYFGLMLTKEGPKVIEYNCRFGDPETQCILPLLKSDLLDILIAVADEKLRETDVVFDIGKKSCCISLCSKGYPQNAEMGEEIHSKSIIEKNVFYFDCGSKQKNNKIITNSGRVFSIVAIGDTLKEAQSTAYKGIDSISFKGMTYRKDIGNLY